jgi:hypothetical protein
MSPILDMLPSDQTSSHPALFIGDVKLSDVKTLLQQRGYKVHFSHSSFPLFHLEESRKSTTFSDFNKNIYLFQQHFAYESRVLRKNMN